MRLAHASGEDGLDLARVTSEFNHLGEAVEWRQAGKRLVGLILRLYVDRTDGPDVVQRSRLPSFLIVAKVRAGASCVVQVIDARAQRDANARARASADAAQDRPCL